MWVTRQLPFTGDIMRPRHMFMADTTIADLKDVATFAATDVNANLS